MILPQSSARIAKLKAQGKATRARLLSRVPDVFTCREMAEICGLSPSHASHEVFVPWRR